MYFFNSENINSTIERLKKFVAEEHKNKCNKLWHIVQDLGCHMIEDRAEQEKEIKDIAKRFWEVEMPDSGEKCKAFLRADEGYKELMRTDNPEEIEFFQDELRKLVDSSFLF